MVGGAATNCWTMSRHGTPGLGSAAAGAPNITHGTMPTAAAATPMRILLGDFIFLELSAGPHLDKKPIASPVVSSMWLSNRYLPDVQQ